MGKHPIPGPSIQMIFQHYPSQSFAIHQERSWPSGPEPLYPGIVQTPLTKVNLFLPWQSLARFGKFILKIFSIRNDILKMKCKNLAVKIWFLAWGNKIYACEFWNNLVFWMNYNIWSIYSKDFDFVTKKDEIVDASIISEVSWAWNSRKFWYAVSKKNSMVTFVLISIFWQSNYPG